MILAALNDYYERRQADADPARRLPAFGRETKEIGFILELDTDGALRAINNQMHAAGNRQVGTPYLVPKGVKKTSGIAANLLWDNAEYVLAVPDEKKLAAAAAKGQGKADDYLARLADMQAAFRQRVAALQPQALADPGVQAVLAFLDSDTVAASRGFDAFAQIAATNPVLSFRLADDLDLVCQRPAVAAAAVDDGAQDNSEHDSEGGEGISPEAGSAPTQAMCLVTGAQAPAERLHTSIKGVWGAQSSGANIVSFNLGAFNSYGKAQGGNAPVSRAAVFAYTTALNALLARESVQRMQVGDASTVFWAQRPDAMEAWLATLLGGDDADAHTRQVRALYESLHSGAFDGGRGENRFYVLGLAPNAARIAVRFWHAAPLVDVARRLAAWFDDINIVHGPNEPAYPTLFAVLRAVAVQGKADTIPPKLGGDVMRSILTGAPYPTVWLNAAVQRCRAEQQVTRQRAAAIKACLNRSTQHRSTAAHPREITPMLDPSNPSLAYRLGRLFATLEKIQEEASPGLNATIRERYYGAASSTPVAVFTALLRLKNHHLAKLASKGRAVNFEKLITEIMSGVDDFPGHLSLPEQGRFAIGYYHQRQELFTKRSDDAGTPADATAAATATANT